MGKCLFKTLINYFSIHWSLNKWDKVFKSRPNKICGRKPLKNLK